MGDPAGVGLEIVLKSPGSKARPGGAVVVYPPFEALRDGARRLGLPGPDEHGVDIVRDGRADAGSLIEAMSLGASLAQYRARAERALQGGP